MNTTYDRRGVEGSKAHCSESREDQSPQTPEEFLDEYVLDRIGYLARRLARQYDLDESQSEDVRQDMIVGVLEASRRFDPAKASWHTFACSALDICCKRFCRQQASQIEHTAGDLLTDDESGENSIAGSAVTPLSYLQDMHTAIDVAEIIAKMPTSLRQTCELLKVHSVSETARILGIHRNVLYRKIERIRAHFERAHERKSGKGGGKIASGADIAGRGKKKEVTNE